MSEQKYELQHKEIIKEFTKGLAYCIRQIQYDYHGVTNQGYDYERTFINYGFGGTYRHKDGRELDIADAVDEAISTIVDSWNQDKDDIHNVWSKVHLIGANFDDYDDSEYILVDCSYFDTPAEDEEDEFHRFLLANMVTSHFRFYQIYQDLLKSRGDYTEAQPMVFPGTDLVAESTKYRLMPELCGGDSLTGSVVYVIQNILAETIYTITRDKDPKAAFRGYWVMNGLSQMGSLIHYDIPMFINIGTGEKPVYRINENFFIDLGKKFLNIIRIMVQSADAIVNVTPTTTPDILINALAPITFLRFISADDKYYGDLVQSSNRYCYTYNTEFDRGPTNLMNAVGLLQYVTIVTSILLKDTSRDYMVMKFVDMIEREVVYEHLSGKKLIRYLWENLRSSLLETPDVKTTLFSNNTSCFINQNHQPIMSLYSDILVCDRRRFKHPYTLVASASIPPNTRIHYELNNIIELAELKSILSPNLNDDNLQLEGLLFFYTVLRVSNIANVTLSRDDIYDAYDFIMSAFRDYNAGILLFLNLADVVDPGVSDPPLWVLWRNTRRFGKDSEKVIGEVEPIYSVGSKMVDYIRAVLWLSKGTVLKASKIINYMRLENIAITSAIDEYKDANQYFSMAF